MNSSVLTAFQNSYNIQVSILHVFCPISQKLYVLHWPVETIQWNIIDLYLIYAWNNTLGNNLESSLILLETKCLQSSPYFIGLLLLEFSTWTCQDFHKILFLPCIHPCMGYLAFLSMGNPLERYDCWLFFNLLRR